jgi:ParB/RepB/Spo0J family partition protein
MSKVMIPTAASNIFEIPVSMIVADPKQNTRKVLTGIPELAKSIDFEGQQTPVLVTKRTDGKFDLVYGYRRFFAISWSKDKGGLEQDTILARVEDEMSPEERLMTNLIENMAREDLSTYDTAMACKQLEDMTKGTKKPLSGASIANKVGKSAPYVNNLLRAVRNLPPNITLRWKEENQEDWEEKANGAKKVMTPDNLARLAKESLTDEERQIAFKKLKGEEVSEASSGGNGAPTPGIGVKRASKAALEAALEAAKKTKKSDKREGIVAALKFALGETEGIKGYYVPEDKEDRAEAN